MTYLGGCRSRLRPNQCRSLYKPEHQCISRTKRCKRLHCRYGHFPYAWCPPTIHPAHGDAARRKLAGPEFASSRTQPPGQNAWNSRYGTDRSKPQGESGGFRDEGDVSQSQQTERGTRNGGVLYNFRQSTEKQRRTQCQFAAEREYRRD
jgi:hypothetical protein